MKSSGSFGDLVGRSPEGEKSSLHYASRGDLSGFALLYRFAVQTKIKPVTFGFFINPNADYQIDNF